MFPGHRDHPDIIREFQPDCDQGGYFIIYKVHPVQCFSAILVQCLAGSQSEHSPKVRK